MRKDEAEKKLAALGFEIDWSVTGRTPDGYWDGVIDPIGRTSICGDCFGPSIQGDNASDWYKNAIAEAEGHEGTLHPCTNPDCDLHADYPLEDRKE